LKNNWLLLEACLLPAQGQAGTVAGTVPAVAANARVEIAFTPGADVAGKIVAAISRARRQVLVQAFSFTHDDIARALLDARSRGVEVRLIADREQTEQMDRSQVPGLARAGLPVWLDGDHRSAHNKVVVTDAGTPVALIITGSFNFTRAAQYKNRGECGFYQPQRCPGRRICAQLAAPPEALAAADDKLGAS
jgi:phosphatidylserine/phosphatidylglycerophosphate/cardiolipin synthase-like enzyme